MEQKNKLIIITPDEAERFFHEIIDKGFKIMEILEKEGIPENDLYLSIPFFLALYIIDLNRQDRKKIWRSFEDIAESFIRAFKAEIPEMVKEIKKIRSGKKNE
jgi:hypothetical protein